MQTERGRAERTAMAEAAAGEGEKKPTLVRIFVGGLGERVTEDELRSIFESRNLGRVEGVDIVRTKGRSFAYCNFLPSSSASLSKLFSTYNGCAWKGGKLRLEKAKEHFLLRLRSEWEEDAAVSSPDNDAVDTDKVMELPEKPKKSIDPESKIRIFFPRLRKVKSLPLKGTGKHKYSFQRVEALSFPKHFCDCEEHSDPSPPSKDQQICEPDLLGGAIDAKEFDLMKSVMNKLFEKEMGSEIGRDENNLTEGKVAEGTNFDEPQHEDSVEEDTGEDEDGLIINMVRSSGSIGTRMNKMSISKRQKTGFAADESGRESLKVQKCDNLSPESSTRSTPSVNGAGGDLPSSNTCGENKPKDQSETHPKWSQKSSWRELLGDKTKTSFSVEHLLPGACFTMEMKIEHDDEETGVSNSVDSEDDESDKDTDAPESVEVQDDELCEHSDVSNSVDVEDRGFGKQEILGGQTEECSESKGAVEGKMKGPNAAASNNSGRGASWLHKSSWTQLMSNNQNQSFSLSQIWSSDKNEELPDQWDDTAITDNKQQLDEPPNASLTRKEEFTSASFSLKEPKNPILQGPGNSNKREEKQVATTDRVSLGIGEECLFMRSSASLRDWANSKAALTRSRKRKKQ